MPNGGSICCLECTYGRSVSRRCDIFGTEVSPFYLCRAFRMPKQSHSEAREHWKMLNQLQPGFVYELENSYPSAGNEPKPAYQIKPIR